MPLSHKRQEVEALYMSRRVNTGGLVSTLPEDLLVEVFSYLVPGGQSEGVSSICLTLAAVCRRWHAVICLIAKFWRDIRVFRSTDWLALSLARCRGAPADITFLDPSFPHSDLSMLLADHFSCIRSLDFRKVEPAWGASISALLTQTAVATLEQLVILNVDSARVSSGLSLSAAQLPRLRILELSGFSVPADVALLRSLRSLSIHHGTLPMLFRDFMSILHENTVLHELSLTDSFHESGGLLQIPAPHGGFALELPHLRKFTLRSGARAVLHHVLHNLRIPNATDIDVVSYCPAALGTDTIGDVPLYYKPSLFPDTRPPVVIFPTLLEMTELRLVTEPRGSRIEARNATRRICLRLVNLPCDHDIGAGICDVIDLFSNTPVSTITLRWYRQDLFSEERLWQTLFLAFPRLETINVSGFGDLRGIWHDFFHALNVSSGPSGHSEVCCPRLKNLSVGVIQDVWSSDVVLEPILHTLRYRARRGSKLDGLELELQMYSNEEDIAVRRIYLSRLKEFVNVVRFR